MKKIKKRLYRILAGAAAFVAALLVAEFVKFGTLSMENNVELILFLIAYFIIGGDVIKKAVSNITRGQVFDEQFLMMLATVCAFFVGEYPEAVAVMLFYQVGELFQSYAVYNSRKSIKDLMNIRPDSANVIRDGQTKEVDPDEVKIDEIILVKPGEKIPLDGTIIEGTSSLDTSALTGESLPRDVAVGDSVISGCININGNIKIQVTKEFGESTVNKILELVENASFRKAKTENFITRFARYYTPVVVILAVILAFVPPIIIGFEAEFSKWLYRALTFLVISCPCALVISIPLSFFGGLGGASRRGVLVKGSNFLEIISDADTVVFDKTGTLTKGNFVVSSIEAEDDFEGGKEKLLHLAAHAEGFSSHPIAKSLADAYVKENDAQIDTNLVSDVKEEPGHGVSVKVSGVNVLAGNDKLMKKENISYKENNAYGTVIYVAVDGTFAGSIVISDEIKPNAKEAIIQLRKRGVKNLVMLTGDNEKAGKKVADDLELDKVYAKLLPQEKVAKLEEIMKEAKGKVVYVGDGVNDAPVLAMADIGVAMGGLGCDAAIEAADIVIMNDEPVKIATVMDISKKTMIIAKENIVFAIGIKVLVLILGAIGMASMWAAVFADVGVAFIAILNAMRSGRIRE